MAQNDEGASEKTAQQKLAEALARRKAEVAQGRQGVPGQRQSEQIAAARATSQSKPAMRK